MKMLTALLIACLGTVPCLAEDWPQWLGRDRDGVSPETVEPWQDEPDVLWRKDVGVGYSAVVARDGRAYTMGNENNHDVLYCLDPETGEEIWRASWRYPARFRGFYGPRSTPAVDDERVYTVGHSGLVKCFRVEDGSEIWSVDLPEQGFEVTNWGVATSPLLRENTILIDMGAVLALSKEDGSIVMRTAMPTPGWSKPSFGAWSSPAVFCDDGQNLVASFNNSELVVAVEETGEILDRAPWMNRRTTNIATPLILDGDDIFITTGYDIGSARFSFDDGKLRKLWQTENLASHSANAIPREGYIYGFDGNLRNPTRLVCVNLETGEEVWGHQDAEKLGAGTLIRASDKLIILGETGWLTIAEATPEGFRPLSQAHILKDEYCWTPPTLANGRIYCRSFNRRNHGAEELVCIQAGGN